MLLDLARPALTPQSCEFALIKQLDNDVFASSKVWADGRQFIIQDSDPLARNIIKTPQPTGTTS